MFEGPHGPRGILYLLYFLLFVWVLQLHICVYATRVPGTPVGRKVSDPLVLVDFGDPTRGCWELNSDALEKQQVLLLPHPQEHSR